MRAVAIASGKELAACVKMADTFFPRLFGLLGESSLPHGEGLWIIPCRGVHTFGMRFPIDVLFLDRDQQVVKSISDLIPNRLTPVCLCAASVLELPGGTLAGIRIAIGERVLFL